MTTNISRLTSDKDIAKISDQDLHKEPKSPSPAKANTGDDVPTFAGSFSAMLSEAYDGDTAEQMQMLAHDRPSSKGEGSGTESSEIEARKNKNVRPVQPPIQEEHANDALLNGVRRKKSSEATKVVSSVDVPPPALTLSEAHERLMLASSQMQIPEVGSHVSFRAFGRLHTILSAPLWLRDPQFAKLALPLDNS